MALFTMEFCAYILPRPIEIRALRGSVSTEFCGKQRHEIGPSSFQNELLLKENFYMVSPQAVFTYINSVDVLFWEIIGLWVAHNSQPLIN